MLRGLLSATLDKSEGAYHQRTEAEDESTDVLCGSGVLQIVGIFKPFPGQSSHRFTQAPKFEGHGHRKLGTGVREKPQQTDCEKSEAEGEFDDSKHLSRSFR